MVLCQDKEIPEGTVAKVMLVFDNRSTVANLKQKIAEVFPETVKPHSF